MANSTVCQSKWKPIVEPRRAKPKTYRQTPRYSFIRMPVISVGELIWSRWVYPFMIFMVILVSWFSPATQQWSHINKQGGTHFPNLCVEVWKILQWCLKHHIVIRIRHIPGKFSVLADRLSRINKIVKTEWALDQSIANWIFQMFTELFQFASVCDTFQSQTFFMCPQFWTIKLLR